MALIVVNPQRSLGTINRNIYGHFSEHLGRCIYDGLYVGCSSPIPNVNGMRTDVVEALKAIRVPVLRWPGGCFADTYHWQDGIGPCAGRKTIVNTNWGGVTEDNSFGTHEFLELCRQLECQPYISGNVGTGTVQELSDWVEYCNMPGVSPMADLRRRNGREDPWFVKYWGIGNEVWGCGGNMTAEYYASLCRQFSSFMREYDGEHKLYKIACGPNDFNYEWTRTLMQHAKCWFDALSLHYYTVPGDDWEHKPTALQFDREGYFLTLRKTLRMQELVENHGRIIRQFEGRRPIGLIVDEWGTWHGVEEGTDPGFLYQQNAMRDALVAAVNLNIFNDHCDTVVMANIAQTVNVLQAMVLTQGEKMLLTPTYHVFEMYKGHQDARQVESYAQTRLIGTEDNKVPDLHVSASQQADGAVLLTVANLDDLSPAPLSVHLPGARAVKGRVLSGAPADHNTFLRPDAVSPKALEAPLAPEGFTALLPPCSVAAFTITL